MITYYYSFVNGVLLSQITKYVIELKNDFKYNYNAVISYYLKGFVRLLFWGWSTTGNSLELFVLRFWEALHSYHSTCWQVALCSLTHSELFATLCIVICDVTMVIPQSDWHKCLEMHICCCWSPSDWLDTVILTSTRTGGFTSWLTWISFEVNRFLFENQVKSENRLQVIMVERVFSILQSLFLLKNEGMILIARTLKTFYSRYIDVAVVGSISAVKCTLVKYSFRHFSPLFW